jgi:hypothetical protein
MTPRQPGNKRAQLVSRVLLRARIASCVPAVIPLVLVPTPACVTEPTVAPLPT